MNFFLHNNGDIAFQNLDASLQELLSSIFKIKKWDSHFLKNYFLTRMCTKNPELATDWENYSEPEISSLLQTCHEEVLLDLTQIKKQKHDREGEVTLHISASHREPWLRILSMKRLSLAAELGIISTGELFKKKGQKETSKLLLQQDFLALLQQCLIEAEQHQDLLSESENY